MGIRYSVKIEVEFPWNIVPGKDSDLWLCDKVICLVSTCITSKLIFIWAFYFDNECDYELIEHVINYTIVDNDHSYHETSIDVDKGQNRYLSRELFVCHRCPAGYLLWRSFFPVNEQIINWVVFYSGVASCALIDFSLETSISDPIPTNLTKAQYNEECGK